MKDFSKEQVGRIAILIVTLFAFFGTDIDLDAMTTTILTIITVINAIGYAIRYAKGDVTILGARK